MSFIKVKVLEKIKLKILLLSLTGRIRTKIRTPKGQSVGKTIILKPAFQVSGILLRKESNDHEQSVNEN